MLPARVIGIGLNDTVQQLDLIHGGFGVVRGRADNFERYMPAVGGIAREPDGGEVSPAELAHHHISAVFIGLANADGVVAAFTVILRVFLFCRVLGAFRLGR